MSGDLLVFGYGSLMYEPELPAALLGVEEAVLEGHRRAFHKRSVPRGCEADEALLPEGLDGWVRGTRRVSLALTTTEDDGGRLVGRVLRYDAAAQDEVLAALARREGVRGDPREDSYVARQVDVRVGGEAVRVLAYTGNPASRWHAPVSEAAAARVLAHATPREPGKRARGVDYLTGARAVLARVGVVDAGLERLAAACREIVGSRAGR